MLEESAAYRNNKRVFEKHAVAITRVGNKLYEIAKSGGWIGTFPMWYCDGGIVSITSAVGLHPIA
jgi:hypothetical protein